MNPFPTAKESSSIIFQKSEGAKDKRDIVYPDSDGKPMADNTKQFGWIVKIKEGLELLFADDPDVFVAGDLLWYPVEGNNKIRAAPDAMVAFGRPKGHRGSYRTWEEGHIVPQVVFEILSPGNTRQEMAEKFRFYERYGVEEYYLYDPDRIVLQGWIRSGDTLEPISDIQGWISPRLLIRFELREDDLHIFRPDGEELISYVELGRQRQLERQKADAERQRAETEWQRAETERQRAEKLAAKLKALGIELE
jgi:Uma2 family endonuclease